MRKVTQAEFGRERDPEVSRQRVGQWVEDGLIELDADGLVDADEAHRRLDASLDRSKGIRRTGNITSESPQDLAAPAAAAPAQETTRAGSDYWESKARRERAEASLSEMKALEAAGALVSAAGVDEEIYEMGRALRNAMFAVPDRVSSALMPGDPAKAHKILTDEIARALREFDAWLERHAPASEGAKQPVEA